MGLDSPGFKIMVCISCRGHVDVHKGNWIQSHVDACGQQVKNLDFLVDVIYGWPPNYIIMNFFRI